MLASLCIFCAATVEAFHYFLGRPNGPLAIVALVAGYLRYSSISLWIQADVAHRGRGAWYDFDSLMFFLWPIAAPIYLFRTREWDAIAPISVFLLLHLAGFLSAAILAYPYSVTFFPAHVR